MTRRRLDAELVRRKYSRSRESAQALIRQGRVQVRGLVAMKPATLVDEAASITVAVVDDENFASRGAHKLIGALDRFSDLQVTGRTCLDAGASTGGFTDVLLRRGASRVIAVDVGYGQLISRLANDDRVRVVDRTNVRHLEAQVIGGRVDLTVADLSFISLSIVLPALTACTNPTGDLVMMVKPQFEVGRDRLARDGVVRDPATRAEMVMTVCMCAYALGWGSAGVVASPLPGPQGNVEFFVWLRRDAGPPLRSIINQAVEAGP